jgi:hypothetical protein
MRKVSYRCVLCKCSSLILSAIGITGSVTRSIVGLTTLPSNHSYHKPFLPPTIPRHPSTPANSPSRSVSQTAAVWAESGELGMCEVGFFLRYHRNWVVRRMQEQKEMVPTNTRVEREEREERSLAREGERARESEREREQQWRMQCCLNDHSCGLKRHFWDPYFRREPQQRK